MDDATRLSSSILRCRAVASSAWHGDGTSRGRRRRWPRVSCRAPRRRSRRGIPENPRPSRNRAQRSHRQVAVPGTRSWDATSKNIHFTLGKNLRGSATGLRYSVRVLGAVKDVDGPLLDGEGNGRSGGDFVSDFHRVRQAMRQEEVHIRTDGALSDFLASRAATRSLPVAFSAKHTCSRSWRQTARAVHSVP
jgi:hypothetical protein